MMAPNSTWIVLACSLLWSVSAASTLQSCESILSGFTVESTETFQCHENPNFKFSQRPVLSSATFWDGTDEYVDNEWTFDLNPALTFETAPNCPSEIKDIACNYVEMRISSSFGAEDGSYFTYHGKHRFGEVSWTCSATDQYGNFIYAAFIFYISGTQSESEIDSAGAQFLMETLWNANDEYTTNKENFDIMKLQKFEQVTSNTEVIYFQTEENGTPWKIFLYTSEDVEIKVSKTHYDIMTTSGPPSNAQIRSQISPDGDCDYHYKLVFPGNSVNNLPCGVLVLFLATLGQLFSKSI